MKRWQRGLYLITPDTDDTATLYRLVKSVLPYSALLQYRNKSTHTALRNEQATMLLNLCSAHDIPLVINDDIELAIAIGAHGVHLGKHDQTIADVRAHVKTDFIIGASCYNSLELAHKAYNAGASYIAFGAFYSSSTKPDATKADVSLLHASQSIPLPKVAIGGIDTKNAQSLVDAGADLIAVINGVFAANNPITAAKQLNEYF